MEHPPVTSYSVATIWNSKKAQVSFGNRASISSFAQDEMVHSFMMGVDPTFRGSMLEAFDVLVQNLVTRLASQIPNFSDDQKKQFVTGSVQDRINLSRNLDTKLGEYSSTKHVSPILAAVGILPKDELAIMAETLVALTSFKRRMSHQAETVGGAIDVAVISKGDGFIWIKRKHYFDPALNVRYMEKMKHL